MKVLLAATEEQQVYIDDLIEKFYSDIFSRSFTSKEIAAFKKQDILNISKSRYNGTMEEALQIISSLQTIYILLEKSLPQELSEFDLHRLEWNCNRLESFGLHFPYSDEIIQNGKRQIH
jgi:hypothetical protein